MAQNKTGNFYDELDRATKFQNRCSCWSMFIIAVAVVVIIFLIFVYFYINR